MLPRTRKNDRSAIFIERQFVETLSNFAKISQNYVLKIWSKFSHIHLHPHRPAKCIQSIGSIKLHLYNILLWRCYFERLKGRQHSSCFTFCYLFHHSQHDFQIIQTCDRIENRIWTLLLYFRLKPQTDDDQLIRNTERWGISKSGQSPLPLRRNPKTNQDDPSLKLFLNSNNAEQ